MMINRRLINLAPESKKHIKSNVLLQVLGLMLNIILIFSLAYLITQAIDLKEFLSPQLLSLVLVILITLNFKIFFDKKSHLSELFGGKRH